MARGTYDGTHDGAYDGAYDGVYDGTTAVSVYAPWNLKNCMCLY